MSKEIEGVLLVDALKLNTKITKPRTNKMNIGAYQLCNSFSEECHKLQIIGNCTEYPHVNQQWLLSKSSLKMKQFYICQAKVNNVSQTFDMIISGLRTYNPYNFLLIGIQFELFNGSKRSHSSWRQLRAALAKTRPLLDRWANA